MYNLYIYEKQLLQNEKEKNDLIKKKNLKKKRKKEIKKLTRNYDIKKKTFFIRIL